MASTEELEKQIALLKEEIALLKEEIRAVRTDLEIHFFYSNPDWKPGEKWRPEKP